MSTDPGVQQTANFTVRIDSTNSPVTEGDTLQVNATVTNSGDAAGEQVITLSIDSTEVDSTTVNLENGQNTSVSLTWATSAGDGGTYTAEMASADDSAQADVAVQAEGYSEAVKITSTNDPLTAGEPLCLDCAVDNTGSAAGETMLEAGIGNQVEPKKVKKYALEPGETGGLHVEFAPEEYNRGGETNWEETVWVNSPNYGARKTVSIVQPAAFDVSIQSTNAPVNEGETLEVNAAVENVGGETASLTVALGDGGGDDRPFIDTTTKRSARKGRNPQTGKEIKIPSKIVDSTGLTLEPGQTAQVTLEGKTKKLAAGDHVVSVAAIPPWERDEWDGPVFGVTPCGDGSPSDAGVVAVDRHGPMKTGRFEVTIGGQTVPGWQSVTLPGVSVEQGEYREGNDPDYAKTVWGQTTFDDLEMERGVKPGALELHNWFEDVRAGKADSGRKEISVKLLNEEGSPMIRWEFQSAWIKNYEPPQLDASADGDMATESVTIAYDEMIRTEV